MEHECFGRCVGILLPEAAINAESRCVECLECEGLFSPHKFVCHSHVAENREAADGVSLSAPFSAVQCLFAPLPRG